jgi:hypothetical protein
MGGGVLLVLDLLLLFLQSFLMLRTVIRVVFLFGFAEVAASSSTMVTESAENRLVVAERLLP